LQAEQQEDNGFWEGLRDLQLGFFSGDAPLWRLSLAPAAHSDLDADCLVDWGGAQRWLRDDRPTAEMRQRAAAHGGHATLFRGGNRQGEVFQPLNPVQDRLHRALKQVFDPRGILNPGRLYPDW